MPMLTAHSKPPPRPGLLRHLGPTLGLHYLTLIALVIACWSLVTWTDPIHTLLMSTAALSWLLHAWALAKIFQHYRPTSVPLPNSASWSSGLLELRTAAGLYVLLLWIPTLGAHCLALAGAGLSAIELIQIGLKAGGGLLAVACGLAVLAVLTPHKTFFALSGLTAGVGWLGVRWLVLSAFNRRWGTELGEHLYAGWFAFALLMLAITMSLCLILLYKGHTPGRILGLTGLFLLIVIVVVVVWTGGLFWLGPGHPSPPTIVLHPPSQPLHVSLATGALRVDPEVGHRPERSYYRLLHTQVRLDDTDGTSWNFAQAHDATADEAPSLGFYAALEETLAEPSAPAKQPALEPLASLRPANPQLLLLAKNSPPVHLPSREVGVQGRALLEERRIHWLGTIPAAVDSRVQAGSLWAQVTPLPTDPSSSELQVVVQSLLSGNERCRLILWPLLPGKRAPVQVAGDPERLQRTRKRLPLHLPYPNIIRESYSITSLSPPPGKDRQISVLKTCAVGRRLARLTDQTYALIPRDP